MTLCIFTREYKAKSALTETYKYCAISGDEKLECPYLKNGHRQYMCGSAKFQNKDNRAPSNAADNKTEGDGQ
jgi:hypothetical protein